MTKDELIAALPEEIIFDGAGAYNTIQLLLGYIDDPEITKAFSQVSIFGDDYDSDMGYEEIPRTPEQVAADEARWAAERAKREEKARNTPWCSDPELRQAALAGSFPAREGKG